MGFLFAHLLWDQKRVRWSGKPIRWSLYGRFLGYIDASDGCWITFWHIMMLVTDWDDTNTHKNVTNILFCRQQLKMVTIIKSPISLSPDSWVPGRCVLRPFVPIWSIKDSELINLFRPRDLVGFRLGNRVSCYSVRSPLFINIRFLGWWSTGGVLDSLVSVLTNLKLLIVSSYHRFYP